MRFSRKRPMAIFALTASFIILSSCAVEHYHSPVIIEESIDWDHAVLFDGTVADSLTCEPIEDARVVLTIWVDTCCDILLEEWLLYSDFDGFFSFHTPNDNLARWIVDIEVTRAGYRDVEYTVTDVLAGDWITFEILMAPVR